MKIRPALSTDAAGIARVHVETWRSAYRDLLPADYLQSLRYQDREEMWTKIIGQPFATKNFVLVLADEQNNIHGFISGGPSREVIWGPVGEVYAIYLSAPLQGQGYGKKLFLAGLEQLALRGFTSAGLWVLAKSQALSFYTAQGGQAGGEKWETIGGQKLQERAMIWDDIFTALKAKIKDYRHPAICHSSQIQDYDNSHYQGSTELLGISSTFSKHFGFDRLGIHFERLPPGRRTSMPHAHENEDEFVFVIKGHPHVWIDGHRYPLKPGDGVGFPAATGITHNFINDSEQDVELMVIGDRSRPNRRFFYPLHPEINDRIQRFYWADHPKRVLGPDDGKPKVQR